MGALLSQLWLDPTYFTQMVRGLIATLGALLASGAFGTDSGQHYGLILTGLSQFITTPTSRPEQARVLAESKEIKP